MKMLKGSQAQMDEAIANNDMVGIHVSHELIEVATKKLEAMSKNQEQQRKVRLDIRKKRKIAINKLFKTNNCDWFFFLALYRLNIFFCSYVLRSDYPCW